jgi:hypothetical protein
VYKLMDNNRRYLGLALVGGYWLGSHRSAELLEAQSGSAYEGYRPFLPFDGLAFPKLSLGLLVFRALYYLVDVTVRRTKVRPCLSRGFPLVDGTDELDAFSLENPPATLDVVDQETRDRSLTEVGVLGVGGAEDFRLAAVGEPEARELTGTLEA